jgi:hypothetical protein
MAKLVMASKFKLLFRDFFVSARKMWLEMMGGLFLGIAIMFVLKMIETYRRTTGSIHTWDWQTKFTVFGLAFFSVLWFGFSLQSFWKARKMR